MTTPLIIAVDGPAASGKGTIAHRLAQHYGLPHLDTGLLYRAVGLGVLDQGGDLGDAALAEQVARALQPSDLTDTVRLTDRGAGEAASREVRARRRWLQLTARGETLSFEDMLADIVRRDARDAGRGAAPMVRAADAALLDTTDMDIEAAFDAARRIVETSRAR